MSEQVVTGGLKSFNYNKNIELKLDDERRNEIKEAYDRHYEKKEREKRDKKRKRVILIVIVLIILALLGIWIFYG